MQRRELLKWLSGLGITLTPTFLSAASAVSSLCNRTDKPDSIEGHPYNANADIPVQMAQAKASRLPDVYKPLTQEEMNRLREKECIPCNRIIDKQRSEMVWYNDGNLPLLIAVPHGGTELVLEVSPRQNRDKADQFSIYGAIYTYEIAWTIRYILEDYFGMRPFMVACLAHRRYVDVNRPPKDAYVMAGIKNPTGDIERDGPEMLSTLGTRYRKSGAPIFFEYHCVLERYINSLYNRYQGKALLLEITGGGTYPNQILRNTMQGLSVKNLRERMGDDMITGERSLMAKIANRGYEVDPVVGIPFPPRDCLKTAPSPDACRVETGDLSGNYTLDTYGSHNPRGIDTFQLNIGREFRTTATYERTGQDLGNAIAEFLKENYLS